MSFLVTKCVCHHKSLKEIITYAKLHNYTGIEELRQQQYCSTKCKMCEPYIELALKTGETEFKPGAYANRRMTS